MKIDRLKIETYEAPEYYDCCKKINEIIDKFNSAPDLKLVIETQKNQIEAFQKNILLIKKQMQDLQLEFENIKYRMTDQIDRVSDLEKYRDLHKKDYLSLKENVDNFDYRLHDIEQCQPSDNESYNFITERLNNIYEYINYFKEKAILKPDYPPDDVKLNEYKSPPPIKSTKYSLAKEGTFEWALIQMKNGNKIKRKDWNCGCCYIKLSEKAANISHDDLLATDWQVCE
jgi:hypothetical protein